MKNNKYSETEEQEIRKQLISKIVCLLYQANLNQLRELKVFVENYIL